MQLRNLKISPESVNRAGCGAEFEAVEASAFQPRGEEVKEVSVRVSVVHGDTLKVKLPLEQAERVRELNKRIYRGEAVKVTFDGLVLRAYALVTEDGKLLAGVSGKAEGFDVTGDNVEDSLIDD